MLHGLVRSRRRVAKRRNRTEPIHVFFTIFDVLVLISYCTCTDMFLTLAKVTGSNRAEPIHMLLSVLVSFLFLSIIIIVSLTLAEVVKRRAVEEIQFPNFTNPFDIHLPLIHCYNGMFPFLTRACFNIEFLIQLRTFADFLLHWH